ncbi:spirocyclase AveC family protein [Nocardia zapadnayensis]|uniref:spirocyclase AveC family protein n=1 Tax=Nocardia rhamnosiphila TaxID=426716 RepID=UPI0022483C59|nr:spirocyclase AveC family protein [Nocardia zapadnayensis]MCX0272935.1 spirocyclase AveC family protein [Nocardia zapadnayensis]
MSELSKKNAPTVTEPLGGTATLGTERKPASKAIRIWAVIGGLVLALQIYVWIRWITGPYFERVPTGPSDPPMLMKTILSIWTAGVLIGFPFAIYWWIIRPWRRERRITLDGILLVSMGLMFFQDPFLNYINTWCTYNTWMFNRGSWSPYVPGWVSPEEPGAQVAEPLLMNIPGYAWGVLLITIGVCWFMRKVKSRWPGISNLRLIGVTFAFTFVLDFVMEACMLLPLGLYTYPGAIQSVSFNAGHYYQWPIYEGVMWGAVQAGLACLRFFTDDRGRTVVERGLDQIRGGVVRQQLTRFLAVFAAVSAIFFVFYNVPAQWFGQQADPWPADIQERSYFTGGICGDGTDKPCPHPDLPMPRHDSGYIDKDGELVLPDGVEVPEIVPFERGD